MPLNHLLSTNKGKNRVIELPVRINPDVDKHEVDLETFTSFINWILGSALDEKIKKDALKVVNCLKFIKANPDYILRFIDNWEVFRKDLPESDQKNRVLRDFDGTSFHLEEGMPGDIVVQNLNELITQFEKAIIEMQKIGRLEAFTEQLQYDKKTGCLEARTSQAMRFAAKEISVGGESSSEIETIIVLDDLFEKLNARWLKEHPDLPGNAEQETRAEQEKYLSFFGEAVKFIGTPCFYGRTSKKEILTRELINRYLDNILSLEKPTSLALPSGSSSNPLTGDLAKQTYLAGCQKTQDFVSALAAGKLTQTSSGWKFCFNSEELANRFAESCGNLLNNSVNGSSSMAPFSNAAQRDTNNTYYFIDMTAEGCAALQSAYDSVFSVPSLPARFLIKSLRSDQDNYFRDFLVSITRSSSDQPRRALREPNGKKRFTIKFNGVSERSQKTPQYSPEEKKFHSKAQSTSLVTTAICPPLFGTQSRRSKLVAAIFDPDDALLNRIFTQDKGTYFRPYDFNKESFASEQHLQQTSKEKFLHPDLESLEQAMALSVNSGKCNEVLARLRWQADGSCKLAIGEDSLAARCLAQDYARQIKRRLAEQARELGEIWDDSYQVPIYFYLPGYPQKHLKYYDVFQQAADRALANEIYQNKNTKNNCLAYDGEQVLVLDNIDAIIQEIRPNGKRYLISLLAVGYTHLAQSLFEQTSQETLDSIQFSEAEKASCIPLCNAVKAGDEKLVNWLIGKGFSFFEERKKLEDTDSGQYKYKTISPHLTAIEHNRTELIRKIPKLAERYSDPNTNLLNKALDEEDSAAIVHQINSESAKMIWLLSPHSKTTRVHFSYYKITSLGKGLLDYALKKDDKEVFSILFKALPFLDRNDSSYMFYEDPQFMVLAYPRHFICLDKLYSGKSFVEEAASKKCWKILKAYFQNKPDLDFSSERCQKILNFSFLACCQPVGVLSPEDKEMLSWVVPKLKSGHLIKDNQPLLKYAANNRCWEVVDFLVEQRAISPGDPDLCSNALESAISEKNQAAVSALLRAGSYVSEEVAENLEIPEKEINRQNWIQDSKNLFCEVCEQLEKNTAYQELKLANDFNKFKTAILSKIESPSIDNPTPFFNREKRADFLKEMKNLYALTNNIYSLATVYKGKNANRRAMIGRLDRQLQSIYFQLGTGGTSATEANEHLLNNSLSAAKYDVEKDHRQYGAARFFNPIIKTKSRLAKAINNIIIDHQQDNLAIKSVLSQ